MNPGVPGSLRTRTIATVALALLLFHLASLVLFIGFSASTAEYAREEQLVDRIVTIIGFIEGAPSSYRDYLVAELSRPSFMLSITEKPSSPPAVDSNDSITELLSRQISQSYPGSGTSNIITARSSGLFQFNESISVSVELLNGTWLNANISASTLQDVFSVAAIPSLTLMAIGAILLASWAVNRPLRSLSAFASASEAMGRDVQAAKPLDENGPRELQDAAKAFNKMLQRVQRLLLSRNQMLGAVSHDFRTPLTRLRLRAETIADGDQRERAIADIEDMEKIIALTLDYARQVSAEESRELTDLQRMIESVLQVMDAEGRCEFTSRKGDIRIDCQPIAMRRALQNVVDNGLKYGDRVRLETEVTDRDVVIVVDDAGPGIPQSEREKVLLPFYRIEQSRNRETGGTGLGLAIAQSIVEAHGGTIELGEAPAGGLRVRIVLPGVRQT